MALYKYSFLPFLYFQMTFDFFSFSSLLLERSKKLCRLQRGHKTIHRITTPDHVETVLTEVHLESPSSRHCVWCDVFSHLRSVVRRGRIADWTTRSSAFKWDA